jgi:isoleucyl-tRNA synthetase
MFETPGALDLTALARAVGERWEREQVFARLAARNHGGPRFSFLDGPITANNPMGVHHAWGRTLKDVIQRYRAMRGFDQRFQNGFDCQGLWVEVEVEKALGLGGKREIETFGLERFARACRERVLHFAAVQTAQSRRLGQWMDWDRSYYTMADGNIEAIWHFLAVCQERGWLVAGRRVMPWCPRCGTSISQHEMLDSHAEVVHEAVTAAFPVAGAPERRLLAWTTTPWTLPANTALAVHPDVVYEEAAVAGLRYYVAAEARRRYPALRGVRRRLRGAELVGLAYTGPFDDLPARRGLPPTRVVAWDAVSAAEGTGIVHVAPGCGPEDAELGRREGLGVVAPLDERGVFVAGFGDLSGREAAEAARVARDRLAAQGLLLAHGPHRHRYPTCWRCREELVFRLVDEWFVRADELRPLALAASAGVDWRPEHMRLRMDDWLRHMDDWCISRKRFWGLPLPFYPCAACGRLTVARSRADLRALAVDPAAVDALPELHRPWIDAVTVACPGCGAEVRRVPEVGDCWLDAGIVPFSTLGAREDRAAWARWFPADVVVEGMGQLRGWFYAMLVMAVTLEGRAPYRAVVAHERVLGADGREMHKSWGNAVWLDEALDTMGPDVVRYLFASRSIAEPVRFGQDAAREVVRKLLTYWNVLSLFTTYAAVDKPALGSLLAAPAGATGLERWLLCRLQSVTRDARAALDSHDPRRALAAVEAFVHDDLSNWYVRRRRRQFWKGALDDGKRLAYETLGHALVRVAQLLAPVVPFLADHVYGLLVAPRVADAPSSVHLAPYPEPDPAFVDPGLEAGMAAVRQVLGAGLAARAASRVTGKRPLARAQVRGPAAMAAWVEAYRAELMEELNVEALELADALDEGLVTATEGDVAVAVDPRPTPALRRKGLARMLVRHVQTLRKRAALRVEDRIALVVVASGEMAAALEEHAEHVRSETLAVSLRVVEPAGDATMEEVVLEGERLRVGVRRV